MGDCRLKASFTASLLLSASAFGTAVFAQTAAPTLPALVSTLAADGETDHLQWRIAPTYSEKFGFGLGTTLGGYINDDLALGLILDYGKNRQEYLANAGLALGESLKMIGSFGLLKEQEEFVVGDGRESLSQLEYGLSLKGNYDAGMVRGFELNAYHTNASNSLDSLETGNVTGVQAVTQLSPSDGANLRLGAGFERVDWAQGDVTEGMTLQVLGSQKISDMVSLNYNAKSAETENVYGVGLSYDLRTPELNSSRMTVSISQIDGKRGISDDRRISLNWTIGFGGAVHAETTGAPSVSEHTRSKLLADVMKRPAFLPERIVVRASGDSGSTGICPTIAIGWAARGLATAATDANDTYYVAYNNSTVGGEMNVAVMSGPDQYVTLNYADIESNIATVFALNGIAPTLTLLSGGGNIFGVDTFYSVTWENADGLFPARSDSAPLTFTFNHNGLSCSYSLTEEILL